MLQITPIAGVRFTLAGEPQGKGRARAFRRGNFIGHYTPDKTRSYEGMVRFAAQQAMEGRLPFTDPVAVSMTVSCAVPKSYSRSKTAAALRGAIRPAKKPDLDNIIKAFTDAMNGVVYADDSQIVEMRATKFYADHAAVAVSIEVARAR